MSTRTLLSLTFTAILALSLAAPVFAGPGQVTVVTASEARAAIADANLTGNETVIITPKDYCAVEAELNEAFQIQPVELNLCNGWTRAGFDLPATGSLTVVLHDRLGRVVQEIQKGELDAGRHTFVFRDHRLPIDTFYLSIRYEDGTNTVNQRLFL